MNAIVLPDPGNPVTEDIMNLEASGEEEESSMTPEHVKHVIDDCKKLLVPDAETILGAWGLIDADPSYVSLKSAQCWPRVTFFVFV